MNGKGRRGGPGGSRDFSGSEASYSSAGSSRRNFGARSRRVLLLFPIACCTSPMHGAWWDLMRVHQSQARWNEVWRFDSVMTYVLSYSHSFLSSIPDEPRASEIGLQGRTTAAANATRGSKMGTTATPTRSWRVGTATGLTKMTTVILGSMRTVLSRANAPRTRGLTLAASGDSASEITWSLTCKDANLLILPRCSPRTRRLQKKTSSSWEWCRLRAVKSPLK